MYIFSWYTSIDMQATNYKCHFSVEKPFCESYNSYLNTTISSKITKKRASFIVIRLESFVYTCYYSGHINVTGIKKEADISKARKDITAFLNLEESHIGETYIDNISSKYFGLCRLKPRNLFELIDVAKNIRPIKKIKYNRERFPALFMKTDFGTLLRFSSSALIAVGSKKKEDLIKLSEIVSELEGNVI